MKLDLSYFLGFFNFNVIAQTGYSTEKAEEFGKQKSVENIEAEAYIAAAGAGAFKKEIQGCRI